MKNHKKWLHFAERDLRFAEVALKEKFLSHCCFLCHQSVEKALKAFLVLVKGSHPKTHHLPHLLALCSESDKGFDTFVTSSEFLNRFYTPTRYPDMSVSEDMEPSEEQARVAFSEAERIIDFVKGRIENEESKT